MVYLLYCWPNSCFVFIIKEKLSERGVEPWKLLSNLPFEGYLLISWLLIKKVSVLRFLHFGDFNKSLSVQLLGGNNTECRGDILVNFSWPWIFYLHISTIFHYEIRPFSICINDVGPVCIDHITSFLNQLSC